MSSTRRNDEARKSGFSFAAIDPYIETNIVSPTEKSQNGRGWVEWGDRNGYDITLQNESPDLPVEILVGTGGVNIGSITA